MKLKRYNNKRNFEKTSEPIGTNNKTERKGSQNKKMQTKILKKKSGSKAEKSALKFVVQHHIATRDHFDFRLEWNGVLLSWAIPKGPSYNSEDKRLAIRVEDHPLEYRKFEGTIPKGQYGGGTVMLWDEGTWEPLKDVDKSLKNGTLKFKLNGKRLMGKWVLIRLKNEEQNNWILIKEKDKYEKMEDISNFNVSITTGRTMSQIQNNEKKKIIRNPFTKIQKQLDEIKSTENLVIGNIKITNPNKLMFKNPDIKKIDIIKYYVKVAKKMLPYLKDRIVSVVRCPNGNSSCFFKKHPAIINEGIVPIKILNSEKKYEEFFYIESIYGLIFEAQMNTIEFHTWASNIKNLEKPDIMVFDLDPDEGMNLKQIRQGVKDLKTVLDQLSLKSFLKTSGGKGYHVIVPFKPSTDWNTFYEFAKNISKFMEQKWPDLYTSNVRKERRKNKIFIDWGRNGRGATTVVPYSVRAKKTASVSVPIFWEELDTISPDEIDIKTALKRLKDPDPWKDFFKVKQELVKNPPN